MKDKNPQNNFEHLTTDLVTKIIINGDVVGSDKFWIMKT